MFLMIKSGSVLNFDVVKNVPQNLYYENSSVGILNNLQLKH